MCVPVVNDSADSPLGMLNVDKRGDEFSGTAESIAVALAAQCAFAFDQYRKAPTSQLARRTSAARSCACLSTTPGLRSVICGEVTVPFFFWFSVNCRAIVLRSANAKRSFMLCPYDRSRVECGCAPPGFVLQRRLLHPESMMSSNGGSSSRVAAAT